MPARAATAPCLPHSGNRTAVPVPVPVPAIVIVIVIVILPVDIVLYLCRKHLPPASAAALSLTCKALFDLVFPRARLGLDMKASERQDLQLLLEKDLGYAWWYCHGCSLLHPISTRGPTGGLDDRPSWPFHWDSARPHHNKRWLDGSSFSVDYQSIRLAMNRHFLGPPNGLPLENFNVEASSIETSSSTLNPWQGKWPPWQEKWSARILQDELFLSATRTLSGAGWTDETLRAALDHEWREICGHVRTSGPAFCSVNALRRPSPTSAGFFTPCRDLVESCQQCLMDYATTVEQRLEGTNEGCREDQLTASWLITITSYYRLGSGRSPSDTKWEGFGKRMTASAYLMRRDLVAYPLGAVKAVWESQRLKTEVG
ncbi:hypothetical protein C8A00DRAFT_45484 [Chaetomidium leptoderma]|uniref:Uncharacterized protein n=1 Tax=Chaetomidium leptoderma TaxID=669021 RepID=A0AAN6VI66_9PEZI|nr:hypothetical protein C8A00DRAFT_45484 [Chaetomidium leptoderma]